MAIARLSVAFYFILLGSPAKAFTCQNQGCALTSRAQISNHRCQGRVCHGASAVATKWHNSRQNGTPLMLTAAVGFPSNPDDPLNSNDEKSSLVRDSLAGLTVAFSLLSKAIACSTIVGVNPLVGIWSSVVMGITSPLCEFLL